MSLTGSQNEMGIPGTGVGKGGLGHQQMTCLGLGVSSPLATVMPEIVIGKIHFQHMSVIGFTNRPTQLAEATEVQLNDIIMKRIRALKSFILDSPPKQLP